jgi:hypothetical protein
MRYYLVTFCNLPASTSPVGILDLERKTVRLLTAPGGIRYSSGTGICRFRDGYAMAATDDMGISLVALFSLDFTFIRAIYLREVMDIHSIAEYQSDILAISTGNNRIFRIRPESDESSREEILHTINADYRDQVHLNSLWIDGDHIFSSSFGDKIQESWRVTSHGNVLCWKPQYHVLLENIYHPHSVRRHGDYLYACESGTGRLLRFTQEVRSVPEIVFDYDGRYIRGLSVASDIIVVGISGRRVKGVNSISRNQQLTDANISAISVLRCSNGQWQEDCRINLDGFPNEIYDIVGFAGNVGNLDIIEFSSQRFALDCLYSDSSTMMTLPNAIIGNAAYMHFDDKSEWHEIRYKLPSTANFSNANFSMLCFLAGEACELTIAFSSNDTNDQIFEDSAEFKVNVLSGMHIYNFEPRHFKNLRGLIVWDKIAEIIVAGYGARCNLRISLLQDENLLVPVGQQRSLEELFIRYARFIVDQGAYIGGGESAQFVPPASDRRTLLTETSRLILFMRAQAPGIAIRIALGSSFSPTPEAFVWVTTAGGLEIVDLLIGRDFFPGMGKNLAISDVVVLVSVAAAETPVSINALADLDGVTTAMRVQPCGQSVESDQ